MARRRSTRRVAPTTPIASIANTATRSKSKCKTNRPTAVAANATVATIALPILSPALKKRASTAVLSTSSKKAKVVSLLGSLLDDEADDSEEEYLNDDDDLVELEEENRNRGKHVDEGKAEFPPNPQNQQSQQQSEPLLPDPHLPGTYANRVRVIDHNGAFCNAMLTDACALEKRSDFVLLQALATTDTNDMEFMVWCRSGQVGTVGVGTLEGPWTQQEDAIDQFCSVFESKTNCDWTRRHHAQRTRTEGFTWIEMDHSIPIVTPPHRPKRDGLGKTMTRVVYNMTTAAGSTELVESVSVHQDALPSSIRKPPSILHLDVQAFLLAIANAASNSIQTQRYPLNPPTMVSESLDTTIMTVPLPLGHLSRSTIERGYEALDALYTGLQTRAEWSTLVTLSSHFYAVIPHPPDQLQVINTMIKLGTKVEMLHALTVLLWREEEAFTFCRLQQSLVKNYLDECYHTLECRLFPLETTSREFGLVQSYIFNSSCCVGGGHARDMELFQVFRVEKLSEAERFAPFRSYLNRRILWHGSRMSNWLGILTHGLLITPPNVPHNGSSFGAGLYFTDKISKAMGYSHPTFSDDKYSHHQVFLLSEVALGDKTNVQKGQGGVVRSVMSASTRTSKSKSFRSCHGVGRCVPDTAGDYEDATGAIWPLGKATTKEDGHATLQHSEYVVYNTAQARMRYLVVTKGLY